LTTLSIKKQWHNYCAITGGKKRQPALPINKGDFMQNRKNFVLTVSVCILLVASSWAQVSKSAGIDGDSTYNQPPIGSQTVVPRDSISKDSLTPWGNVTASDQKSNKTDIDITKNIRKEIMARKGMSVNAQNVKIVSIDGKVTLRGTVNTAGEKEIIGHIANTVASSENVTNELQIK
jgi:osmotically-inducible protein OsmY